MTTPTQTQHTPGPWKQHSDGEKTYASVRGAKNQTVADCGSRSDRVAQANARLIAAAPELLRLLCIAADEPITIGLHTQIQAAIARAEGRTP